MAANDPNDMYRRYPPQPPVDPWAWMTSQPSVQAPQLPDWYSELLRRIENLNRQGGYGW